MGATGGFRTDAVDMPATDDAEVCDARTLGKLTEGIALTCGVAWLLTEVDVFVMATETVLTPIGAID